MGLENTQNGNMKYLNVMNGSFIQRVDENTVGAKPRVLKKGAKAGTTVWELHHNRITGLIKSIKYSERVRGGIPFQDWAVLMEDGDEKFLINFIRSSSYSRGFLFRLPNIDLAQFVEINTFSNYFPPNSNPGDRPLQGVSIKQNGNKIQPAFDRDSSVMPPLKLVQVNGVNQYDDSDRHEFLIKMVTSITGESPIKEDVPADDFNQKPSEHAPEYAPEYVVDDEAPF